MTDQTTEYSPLSPEQVAKLSDAQKEIYQQLDDKDRQFFAQNFSPASLGKALERKWETLQSRARVDALDKRLRESIAVQASQPASSASISAGDIAAGAAGIAGAVGIGVLAKKIAPEGVATWRGVNPRDLVNPLVEAFARQEKTDIRFLPPNAECVIQATVLLRTPPKQFTGSGLAPALDIVLTPLGDTTQVQVSKISSESVMETLKRGGQELIDMLQDGLSLGWHSGGNLFDLAGQLVDHGVDIAKTVKDLDLEDRAWEAIQRAAEPLQAIYDEKMKVERERLLKIEMEWDDYNSCPRCRVEFGAEDVECRVCGAARPPKPNLPDPRNV